MRQAAAMTSVDPAATAVTAAVDRLRMYVDRDRQLMDGRRRANSLFRQARLRMGYELNQTRKSLTRTSFGIVLRRLGLNKHTANHAMRLAAEFSRPDGSLDLDKIADARDRGAGVLRTSIPGQRILAADPERLSCDDLRRLMRARPDRCTRQEPKPSVEGASHFAACTRHESEHMVAAAATNEIAGSTPASQSAGACPPAGPAQLPVEVAGGVQPGTLHAAATPRASGASTANRTPIGGAAGVQLSLPFDEVVHRHNRLMQRMVGHGLLCPMDGDPRMAELRELLARADDLALSLLRGGAGE